MKDISVLKSEIRRIDKKGYKAYKDIKGAYNSDSYNIYIDRVQGDPFAAPSDIRLIIKRGFLDYPDNMIENNERLLGFEDYLTRLAKHVCLRSGDKVNGSGKSGALFINSGGQEVVERSAVFCGADNLELRLSAGLPASGRTILGKECEKIFFEIFPGIIEALKWKNIDRAKCKHFVDTVENQFFIRNQLNQNGLSAFVADGSVLPRESGNSEYPLKNAVPFKSPESLRIRLKLKNKLEGEEFIEGMGVKKGVTTIAGGGFHGKSTLLEALKMCVYPHIPGDGREYVVTNPTAVSIRAEDGRNIPGIDIRPFIDNLPMNADTSFFKTTNASGSTSQAVNILETVEAGSKLILIDEDTSATNFMIKDQKMQTLIHRENEPITPFVSRVRDLYDKEGVSTILVMGGNGDYLGVSDYILLMRNFCCEDVTKEGREIYYQYSGDKRLTAPEASGFTSKRMLLSGSFDFIRNDRKFKIKTMKTDRLIINKEEIDLRSVEQFLDESQVSTAGKIIKYIADRNKNVDLETLLNEIAKLLDKPGFDFISKNSPGMTKPRVFEVFSALNRLRKLKVN